MNKENITAIIACAGSGTRAKLNENKIFAPLYNNETVLHKTVSTFSNVDRVDDIIIVYKDGELEKIKSILFDIQKPIKYVIGGDTRYQSIKNALDILSGGIVLIHDGARPFISIEDINKCISSVKLYGSGVLATNLTDTILETDNKNNIISSSRKNKYKALTPQCFKVEEIKKAYSLTSAEDGFTDDAGVYTATIGKCKLVMGDSENNKLTYPSDFKNSLTEDFRVGVGFDLHKLVEDRKLIIAGIEIPHIKGLLGHSDADVVLHAIMDSLLSSVCMRDIGYHFSDKDPKYKDISSVILFKEVMKMLKDNNYKPYQVSVVIMAEKPKMSKYVDDITNSLATLLEIDKNMVGVTLTTLEGIGVVGREEGIACESYCLVKKVKNNEE